MRLCFGLALAILLAGSAHGIIRTAHIDEGDAYTFTVLTLPHTVEKCHIKTPSGQVIDFAPGDETLSDEKYVIGQGNAMSLCELTLKNADEHDGGTWEMYFTHAEGTGSTQSYIITVGSNALPENEPNSSEEKSAENNEQPEEITYLTEIRYATRLTASIDISLNKETFEEECYIRPPNGELIRADLLQMDGVTVQSKSNFVSCRITIGPMTAALIGSWTLCGKSELNGETRCQPVDIAWNGNNGLTDWGVTNRLSTDIPVHVGGSANAVVGTSGTLVSCHVITPAGEDLVISSDVRYPRIENTVTSGAICSVLFRGITEDMFGEWVILSRFRAKRGQAEIRQPLLLIPNGEPPEDENMTLLREIDHFTGLGASIDITLNKEIFDEDCYIRPPGSDLIRADILQMDGVTAHSKSIFVSCRVTIGPMTEDLIGTWRLCGKSVLTEESRCQPVNISWNGNNGLTEWTVTNRLVAVYSVNFGGSVSAVAGTSATLNSCHVVTPAGEDLVVSSELTYPHIEITLTRGAICNVNFRDITRDMLGDWVIYSRYRAKRGQAEIRQPLNFFLFNEDNPYDQAYDVTDLEDVRHLVRLGTELTVQVSQRAGVVQDCVYRKPSGETFNLNNYQENTIEGVSVMGSTTEAVCQIVFNPITEEAIGEWQIIGMFNNGLLYDKIRQTFEIIKEDPENPIEDKVNREIVDLDEQDIYTEMDTTHRVVIDILSTITRQSCHLITPAGRQYAFIDGFDVPGVEIIDESRVDCGVVLNLRSYDMIGNWTLIARGIVTRQSNPIERRLPFTIHVEDNFVLQNDISITKGSDLYLHLNYATDVAETCAVYGPDGQEYSDAEEDPLYPDHCGFIIRGVDQRHAGEWILEYGARSKRRGSVKVDVLASQEISVNNLRWTVGQSVDMTLGPEDAVYCKIEDPYNHILFDGFSQCRIVLDRVALDHRGLWHMYVGVPGTIQLQTIEFTVSFEDDTSLVTTSVQRNAPAVMISCAVPVEHEVSACTFRTPQGETLVATHGVGEDRYMFNGSFTNNYESEADSHDCTLRLVSPTVLDLGIWRCAMHTNTGTYYGFLTVICPFLMQNPEIAATVVTEPVLRTSSERQLSYEEYEPAVMSCSIHTKLQYCYFRARNGTIYNVFPNMPPSQNFEYVGAGLVAGDCGIRFKSGLTRSEGGMWSCHVGLANTSAPEQRVSFNVDIRAQLSVYKYWHPLDPTVMVLETASPYDIDYCRFVRIDGHGFTINNLPDVYEINDDEPCTMYIRNPTILDVHPWTIAVKFTGQKGEVSMTTTENLFNMPTEPINIFSKVWFWLLIVSVFLFSAMLAFALIPRKNRKWTYKRASLMRNSFRNSWNRSFEKKPVQENVNKDENIQNTV